MKVLIWVGYLTVAYIVNSIFGAVIKFIPISSDSDAILVALLGGIVYALIEVLAIWLAIKHCKRLDMYRVMKKAAEAGMSVSEYGRHGLSEKFISKLEEMSNTVPYEQVKSQLKDCVKKGKITKEQYIILLEEYCNKK